jgi:hypothetical protein
MTGENPYAPPTVSEPESVLICSGDGWRLLGDILLVRMGATLPQVDLETGASSPPLRLYRFPYSLFFPPTKHFHCHAIPNRIPRRWVRNIVWNLSMFLLLFAPQALSNKILPTFISKDYFIFLPFAVIIIFFAVTHMDRPKLVIEDSVTPGWLRVTNLHPDALACLREMADSKSLRYYPPSR